MLSCSVNSLAPTAEQLPSSLHDHSKVTTACASIVETHFGRILALIPEQRAVVLETLSRQRWADAEAGTPAYQSPYNELQGGEAQFLVDYHDYYMTPRGYHPRAVNSGNAWTVTTPLPFMNLPILTHIAEISPRPMLLIHGENAHSRYFSEIAYQAAAEPKELLIIPGTNHTDLYDKLDVIPFDRLAAFFGQHLAA